MLYKVSFVFQQIFASWYCRLMKPQKIVFICVWVSGFYPQPCAEQNTEEKDTFHQNWNIFEIIFTVPNFNNYDIYVPTACLSTCRARSRCCVSSRSTWPALLTSTHCPNSCLLGYITLNPLLTISLQQCIP